MKMDKTPPFGLRTQFTYAPVSARSKITTKSYCQKILRLASYGFFTFGFSLILNQPPGRFCQQQTQANQNSNVGVRWKPGRMDGCESKASRSEKPLSRRR
jgi:hypothetical protein